MDGERFDALAKVVAALSRRGVLRLLAGAALGAAVASSDGAAAAGCRERGELCERDSDCCGWEGRRRTVCTRRGATEDRSRCCSRRGGSCAYHTDCCGDLGCLRGNCFPIWG